jgi:hypothetical protein
LKLLGITNLGATYVKFLFDLGHLPKLQVLHRSFVGIWCCLLNWACLSKFLIHLSEAFQ